MFTGRTKNLGILGWPVEHSLSPAMQNAALQKAGLDYVYVALPVQPKHLGDAVAGLRHMGFAGWNVTIPHKSEILPLLDDVHEDARVIGAVNTVVRSGEKLIGYNTDVAGFLAGLEAAGCTAEGKHAVMLGAGGAARAVLWGLCKSRVSDIVVGVRNPQKAQTLADDFRGYGRISVLHWADNVFAEALSQAELLINTTPIGMYPKVDDMPPVELKRLPKSALVYDIIYTPEKTKLLQEAERLGHPIVNGEPMLVGQGAEAFRLWTGVQPDEALMRRILREGLV